MKCPICAYNLTTTTSDRYHLLQHSHDELAEQLYRALAREANLKRFVSKPQKENNQK